MYTSQGKRVVNVRSAKGAFFNTHAPALASDNHTLNGTYSADGSDDAAVKTVKADIENHTKQLNTINAQIVKQQELEAEYQRQIDFHKNNGDDKNANIVGTTLLAPLHIEQQATLKNRDSLVKALEALNKRLENALANVAKVQEANLTPAERSKLLSDRAKADQELAASKAASESAIETSKNIAMSTEERNKMLLYAGIGIGAIVIIGLIFRASR